MDTHANGADHAAAFFVDFDSLFHGLLNGPVERQHKRALEESLNILTAIRGRLREQGTQMVLGRAYAAFDEYPGSEAAHSLSLIGYEPQYVIHKKGRTSADLHVSLDLLEVLLSRADIDKFVILGGDLDYLPIARRVLEARRELLIVSLAQTTSGDLIDRVGPDRFFDAAQLIEQQVDEAPAAPEPAPVEPAPVEPAPVEPPPPPPVRVTPTPRRPRAARILGHTELPKSTWTPCSDAEALSEERQSRCLRLLIGLAQRFASSKENGKPEVWLSPFLKNEMAEHFPHLTHPQRRRLVNLLKEHEKIIVEERQSQTGPYPYSVVMINDEHPAVIAMAGTAD